MSLTQPLMRPRRTPRPAVSAKVAAAAAALAADVVAAEVAEALRGASIPTILLRGPSIARHVYRADEPRAYADVDLLVKSAAMDQAERVLADHGFTHSAVLGQRPDDRPAWSRTWQRSHDGGEVDLHTTVVGVGVPPHEVWTLLSENAEALEVARARLAGLNARATAVLIALHVAQHGTEVRKPLDDLARAIERFPYATWEAAATLAERLAAVPAFAAGLRLLPAGAALAQRLSLPDAASAEVILRVGGAPPMALGFEWLSHVPGFRAKSRLIVGKLFPDVEFMRAWSPVARRGRVGLATAYLFRIVWLAWHGVPGFISWARARRSAR
jgi:hypothetical protein